ncbi:MAG TPA: S41 family peptidase, partial [Chitinophagaceae bacterium]|nr:S41 family peptidase [Chitinophagaceae bacterium]
MKPIISLIAMFTMTSVVAQKSYSDQEIKRLADLGRLWGMLHYFHPKMGTGEIATDSLILSPTASLIADPSAANFERCVKHMLSRVNDPSTKLQQKNPAPALLFSASADKPALHKLPDDILYVAFPPIAAKFIDNIYGAYELMPAKWDSAKAIILDLRNATKSSSPADLSGLFWQLQFLLTGNQQTPEVYERSIYHSGLVSQGDARGYPYYAGWRTSHKGGPNEGVGQYKFPKPMVIVYNSYTEIAIVKFILSVRAAGLCKLVYEGNMSDYQVGNNIPVNLSDGLVATLRVSDYVVGNDQSIPLPDFQVDQIKDTSLSGNFINRCLSLLTEKTKQEINKSNLSWQYIPPKPGWYIDEPLPTAEKRLYALYNWWNAVQYLYPHKNLIERDWDGVLTQYIPQMINSNDSLSYYFSLLNITAEIHDNHTIVLKGNSAPRFQTFEANVPVRFVLIENKTVVIDKARDSLGVTDKIEIWDELTHINDRPLKTIMEERSQWGFIDFNITSGPFNSVVKLRLKRKGKPYTVDLIRGRSFVFNKSIFYSHYPNINYHISPTIKILDDNIGYVKMESLNPSQVDSMMKAFENTRAIIFDIRGYPRGTAHRITSYLTNKEKIAVKYEKPYVTYGHLLNDANPNEQFSQTNYRTVIPLSQEKYYKGKVIVLCNGRAGSHAETSIMLFQAVNATTIGSQTVGANGNIT